MSGFLLIAPVFFKAVSRHRAPQLVGDPWVGGFRIRDIQCFFAKPVLRSLLSRLYTRRSSDRLKSPPPPRGWLFFFILSNSCGQFSLEIKGSPSPGIRFSQKPFLAMFRTFKCAGFKLFRLPLHPSRVSRTVPLPSVWLSPNAHCWRFPLVMFVTSSDTGSYFLKSETFFLPLSHGASVCFPTFRHPSVPFFLCPEYALSTRHREYFPCPKEFPHGKRGAPGARRGCFPFEHRGDA